jgi:CubicO group peptidase (beta-lactamase class C family)
LLTVCLVIAGLLGLVGCATLPARPAPPVKPAAPVRGDYGYTKAYASWLIRGEMAKHGVTGLSIALVDDQQVVWTEGFGFADAAGGVPATPETVYRAGSLSKLLTVAAALQLADDGLLDLDRPLQRYLPEFSIRSRFADAPPITVRSLMTHHSGLPGDLLKGMWTAAPGSLDDEMLQLREEYLTTPPGTVFSYSNPGMSLLGRVVEKVAERDFDSQAGIALFLPLKMTSSAFSPRIDRSPRGSRAYRGGIEAAEPPLRDVPAGGLNTTVLDLSRFMAMVFGDGWYGGGQVLRSGTVAEMLRPQNGQVPLDLSFRVGLGWMLSSIGGLDIRNAGPVAHHGGATLHHRSQMVILPQQKLGVVVLANSASAGPVVTGVATEILKLALEAKAGITQEPAPPPPAAVVVKEPLPLPDNVPPKPAPRHAGEKKRGTLTEAELEGYSGRYDTLAGLVDLRKSGDHLEGELFNRTMRLVPRPDGLLDLRYRLLGLLPVSLGELDRIAIDRETIGGRDLLKAVLDGREYLAGVRLPPTPVPASWQRRAGEYEIVNDGDDTLLVEGIRLRAAGESLTVEYAMPLFTDQQLNLALVPLSETEAVIGGLGRGRGDTIRVVTRGGEELLAYSGYLLRKKPE